MRRETVRVHIEFETMLSRTCVLIGLSQRYPFQGGNIRKPNYLLSLRERVRAYLGKGSRRLY